MFVDLKTLYDEVDRFLAIQEFNAHAAGRITEEKDWARKRELNDHAYFLFMFTKFEEKIREYSSKLILKKQSSLTSWNHSRVWDLLPKDKDSTKITLKNRLALLLDKGSSDYQKVNDYYEQRNCIAHGGSATKTVAIPTAVSDFIAISKKIKV